MVYLFYAFTATQLINMCNLKHFYFKCVDSDIYIQTGNRISPELINQISQFNLFNKIYVNNHLVYDNGLISNVGEIGCTENLLKKIFVRFPKWFKSCGSLALFILQNIQLLKEIQKSKNYGKYDRIFVGTFGISSPLIIRCVSKNSKKIPLSVVEEGTVNYQRPLTTLCMEYPLINDKQNQSYWIAKIFGITKKLCLDMVERVDEIYLYSPESYPYNEMVSIRYLPQLTIDNPIFPLLVSEADNFVIDDYVKRNYCYLLQDKTPVQNELLECILQVLPQEKLILREHPWHPVIQDIGKEFNLKNIRVDNSSKFATFESIVSKLNPERFVLITTDSSAALTPKYMFNKEPYIIFLYHLTLNRSESDIDGRDALVESLRGLYTNKERIYVPKSLDELSNCLKDTINLLG